MAAKLSPEENVWLQILKLAPELEKMNAREVRKKLEAGGFPNPLIEKFLRERK